MMVVKPRPDVIAVIGGGFSGTLVAVNLARRAGNHPPHVVLFERGTRFARGVAYGTSCPRHLLNVPAGMMSALVDEPGHFLDWLRVRDPVRTPGRSPPAGSTANTWRNCSRWPPTAARRSN